jgi:hypothetical protein
MANLIPQENKKWIRQDYLLRVLTMALSMIAFVIIAGIVSVIPTYVMLQTEMSHFVQTDGTTENANLVTNSSSTDAMIKELRSRMELLKSNINVQSVSLGIIPDLFKIKPAGVYLSNISFSKGGKKITVQGMAATNKDLRSFIEAVKVQQKTFLPIPNDSLPFAAMSQPKDVPFTLEIKLQEFNAK